MIHEPQVFKVSEGHIGVGDAHVHFHIQMQGTIQKCKRYIALPVNILLENYCHKTSQNCRLHLYKKTK